MNSHPAPSPQATVPPGLPPIDVAIIEVELAPTGAPFGLDTWPGSAIRGALGRALRRQVCTSHLEACRAGDHEPPGARPTCPELGQCLYGRIWEGGSALEAPLPSGWRRNPPAPYSVMPLAEAQDGTLVVHVKLVGQAAAQWATVLAALAAAAVGGLGGGRRPGRLRSAVALAPYQDAEQLVYRDGDGLAVPADRSIAYALAEWAGPSPAGPASVELETTTPLALKRELHPPLIDPCFFTRRLGGRLGALALIEGTTDWDPRPLFELANGVRAGASDLRPFETFRESDRPGRSTARVPLAGLVGHARFHDVPPALARLWSTANVLHVGKSTAFGLGAVALSLLRD